MSSCKFKKPKVSKDDDQGDSQLVLSIEKLKETQTEVEKVQEEEYDKVVEIQQKYNEISRPVYDRRNEIIKAIPNLWFNTFNTHPVLGGLLTVEDKNVWENPYFENVELTKTCTFSDDGTATNIGTEIKWKEDMSPTKKRGRKTKKWPPSNTSFFNWLNESQENHRAYFYFDKIAEIIKDDLWLNPLNYMPPDGEEEDHNYQE